MPGHLHTWGTVTGEVGSLITFLDRALTGIRVAKNFDGTATYTDHTSEARLVGGTPFTLLADSGDIFYWGFDVKATALLIDIATAAAGMGALTWEYWNGSAWTTLTVVDGTTGFTVDGEVTWTAPGNWATTSVDSVTAYYVRVRCASGPSTPPTAGYTVENWRIYDGIAGTNTKVYFSPGEDGSGPVYLWVEDNGAHTDAKTAGVALYEAWDAGLHTGTAATPTAAQVSGGSWWHKSNTADATSRNIHAYVSRDILLLLVEAGVANVAWAPWLAVRLVSRVVSDAYAWRISGAVAGPGGTNSIAAMVGARLNAVSSGHYIQRSYDGAGGSKACGLTGVIGGNPGSGDPFTFPNPPDGGLMLDLHRSHEATNAFRGFVGPASAPVLLLICHTAGSYATADIFTKDGQSYRIYRAAEYVSIAYASGGPQHLATRNDG